MKMKAGNDSENQQSCWSLSSWQSGGFFYFYYKSDGDFNVKALATLSYCSAWPSFLKIEHTMQIKSAQ